MSDWKQTKAVSEQTDVIIIYIPVNRKQVYR
jgi:hypothetical protein